MAGRNDECRDEERLYQERVNDIPDWLWEVNTQGVFTYSNAVIADTLGYTPEEIIGKSVFSLLVPEDVAKCRRVFELAVEKQEHVRNVLGRFVTSDQAIKILEVSCVPILDHEHQLSGFRGISRDVTEFLAQQHAALEVEQAYRALVDNSLTGIVIIQNERVVMANPAMTTLMGYTIEEALGAEVWQFVHPDDRSRIRDYYMRRMSGIESPSEYEVRLITRSGEVRYFELRATPIQFRGAPAVLDNIIDVTERRCAEDELRDRNAELEAILHAFPDLYFWLDSEGRYEGYHVLRPEDLYLRPEQFMGKRLSDGLPKAVADAYEEAYQRVRASQCTEEIEYYLPMPQGRQWYEARLVPLPEDKTMVIVRNITSRKNAEDSLRKSEEKFRDLVENTFDWVWEIDVDDKYTYVSPRIRDLLGYEPREVLGKTPFDFMPPDEAEHVREVYHAFAATRKPFWLLENVNIHKDGHMVVLQTSGTPRFDDTGKYLGYRGMDRDITDAKEAEKELRRANRALRVLSDCNQALIRVIEEQELFDEISRIIVEVGGYRLVMVGFAEENAQKSIRLAAVKAANKNYKQYIEKFHISWADTQTGWGPTGTAIRTGETTILRDLWTNTRFKAWREAAIALDYRSGIGLPLRVDDRVIGSLTIFAQEADAFDSEEVKLLEELADDIAFGMQAIRNRKERERAEEALRYRLEFENAITNISTNFINLPVDEIDTGIDRALAVIGEYTGGDRSYIFVSHNGGEVSSNIYEWCAEGIEPQISNLQKLRNEDYWWFAEQILNQQTVEISNLDDLPPEAATLRELLKSENVVSLLAIPMILRGDVVGLLGIESSHEVMTWSEEILTLLRVAGEVFVNAVDRKATECALAESQRTLSTLMSNLPGMVYRCQNDRNWTMVFVSEGSRALTGYDPGELIESSAVSYNQLVHSDDRDRVWDEVQASLLDRAPFRIEYRIISREGEVKWVSELGRGVFSPDNELEALEGFIYDVTVQKLTQDALQEAEAKYRSLVEESLMGVYIIQGGRFTYVNPRMAEIFGYSQDEMVSMEVLNTVQPEDRSRVVENIRKRIDSEIQSIRYTFTGIRKDGSAIEVEVYGSRTVYQGKSAIIGSLADITERKQRELALAESEERYRLLFENSPDIVLILEADGIITAISPTVKTVLGYEPGEVVGRIPSDFSPEYQPDGENSREKAQRYLVLAQTDGPQLFEWTLRHKDGSFIITEVSLNAYVERNRTYIQSIVRDVSERKRAEEHRLRLEKRLESQKRQFYRETIRSVTGGKLDIVDQPDIHSYIMTAEMEENVLSAAEVPIARHAVDEYLTEQGLEPDRLEPFMIGVGEAITNAIKHGIEGHVYAGVTKESVWVAVQDRGKGIESLILPQATLMRGFSTKPSLGLGYSIMLDVSDSIMLKTGPTGTTVVLFKYLKEHALQVSTDMLPDTWNNIPS